MFTGRDAEGGDFWSVLPRERHHTFREGFTRARHSGRVVKFDEYVPELGRWYLLSVHPMPEGKLLVFLRDTSTDVEEDYRTRTLLQHSGDGVLLLNADLSEQYHHNVLWAEGDARFSGVSHLDCVYGQDLERFRAAALNLAAGTGVDLRYRLQVPGSGWRWLRARITNRLADPGTRALVVNYRDVTAEQQTRTEIVRRQEELRKTGASLALRLSRLQRLHQVARIATIDSLSLSELLSRTVAEVAPEGAAAAWVFIKSNERMLPVADSDAALLPPGSAAAAEANRLAVRAFDARQTLNIDLRTDPAAADLRQLGFERLFAIPFSRSGTHGVTLTLARTGTADPEELQRYIETIAGFITSTIAARFLIERLERSAADSHTLARFGHQVERLSTSRELLQKALNTLFNELDLRLVQFCDVRQGRVVPRAVLGPETVQQQTSALKELDCASDLLHRVVHHALPSVVNDLSASEGVPAQWRELGLISVLAVPLQHNDSVRSLLVLGHADEAREFTEAELSFSVLFAERLATALQRVEYLDEIRETRDATFRALGRALEYRDYETLGHTDRVTRLVRRFALSLGLSEQQLQSLTWGAYLHDLGKLGIPDGILQKPERLTPAEFEIVQLHTVYGAEMCRDIPFLPEATHQIVRSHHERWDGSGYPDALAGEDIPFAARLFALVDVFDALTTERVYKEAWPVERALDELERLAGQHFDPQLTPKFVQLIRSQPD